jgi:hypothetical protein
VRLLLHDLNVAQARKAGNGELKQLLTAAGVL